MCRILKFPGMNFLLWHLERIFRKDHSVIFLSLYISKTFILLLLTVLWSLVSSSRKDFLPLKCNIQQRTSSCKNEASHLPDLVKVLFVSIITFCDKNWASSLTFTNSLFKIPAELWLTRSITCNNVFRKRNIRDQRKENNRVSSCKIDVCFWVASHCTLYFTQYCVKLKSKLMSAS